MKDFKEEIWKDIPGFEGLYQASNYGNIKSLERVIDRRKTGKLKIKERILLPNKRIESGFERWTAHLYKDGTEYAFSWGRCIYSAFNGPIPEGMEVNHIDERPDNNRLDNLNLMTHKENLDWGTGHQRRAIAKTNGKASKVVLQYELDGTFVKEYPSTKEVKRQTGYNCGCISNVCNGIRRTAFGYIWRYKEYV